MFLVLVIRVRVMVKIRVRVRIRVKARDRVPWCLELLLGLPLLQQACDRGRAMQGLDLPLVQRLPVYPWGASAGLRRGGYGTL